MKDGVDMSMQTMDHSWNQYSKAEQQYTYVSFFKARLSVFEPEQVELYKRILSRLAQAWNFSDEECQCMQAKATGEWYKDCYGTRISHTAL